jgi:hypothetical protein
MTSRESVLMGYLVGTALMVSACPSHPGRGAGTPVREAWLKTGPPPGSSLEREEHTFYSASERPSAFAIS